MTQKRKGWTEEELNYLIENYPAKYITIAQICEHLNKKPSTVQLRASKLGLTRTIKMPVRDGYKWCNHCCQELPVSEFTKRSDTNGLRAHCKSCRAKKHFEYNQKKKTAKVLSKIIEPKIEEKYLSTPEDKVCKECNITKPIGMYYKNRGNKDGFENFCKVCSNKRKEEATLKRLRERGY